MRRVVTAAIAAALVAGIAWGSQPAFASSNQYVLKHPQRERCKSHYVKRVAWVRVRVKTKTKRVRETLCVHTPTVVPPARPAPVPIQPPAVVVPPTPPPPTPPTVPALTGTVTKLEVPKSEECKRTEGLAGNYTVLCHFIVRWSVSSIEGPGLTYPQPSFTFSNPGEPTKTWTFDTYGTSPFLIEVERGVLFVPFTGEYSQLIDPTTGQQLAISTGGAQWSVYATYPGTKTYAPSTSATLTFEGTGL
jgi:hypothetical protein